MLPHISGSLGAWSSTVLLFSVCLRDICIVQISGAWVGQWLPFDVHLVGFLQAGVEFHLDGSQPLSLEFVGSSLLLLGSVCLTTWVLLVSVWLTLGTSLPISSFSLVRSITCDKFSKS